MVKIERLIHICEKVKKSMRKILFSQRRERTDVRVQPCRFHEDTSRFIVAKIVEKTGFLSPMHAHTMYTCDICDHVSKKSIKENQ